ncbi:hypothetical protein D3C79_235510 [compost metagenome]
MSNEFHLLHGLFRIEMKFGLQLLRFPEHRQSVVGLAIEHSTTRLVQKALVNAVLGERALIALRCKISVPFAPFRISTSKACDDGA